MPKQIPDLQAYAISVGCQLSWEDHAQTNPCCFGSKAWHLDLNPSFLPDSSCLQQDASQGSFNEPNSPSFKRRMAWSSPTRCGATTMWPNGCELLKIYNLNNIVHRKHVHTMNYVPHQMCGKIFLDKHYLSSWITFLAPNECNHSLLQTKSYKSTKANPSKTKTFSSHHFSLCYCSGQHTFDNPEQQSTYPISFN